VPPIVNLEPQQPETKLLLRASEGRIVDVAGPPALYGTTTISSASESLSGEGCIRPRAGGALWCDQNLGLTLPGKFTIECWTKPEAKNPTYRYNCLLSNYNVDATGNGGFALSAGGEASYPAQWVFFAYMASAVYLVSTTPFQVGVWTHLAVVRADTTIKLYVNGVEEASVTSSTAIKGVGGWYFGHRGNNAATSLYQGLIEDIRVTRGLARYTQNFTPEHPLN